MTLDQFDTLYNPHNRCHAIYRDQYGYQVKGLLLDGAINSVATGQPFVFVNNFNQRVNLADLIDVIDTGKAWQ